MGRRKGNVGGSGFEESMHELRCIFVEDCKLPVKYGREDRDATPQFFCGVGF